MEIDVRGFLHSKTEIQCLFEKQNSLNLIRELLERPFSIQINELTRKKSTISFNGIFSYRSFWEHALC